MCLLINEMMRDGKYFEKTLALLYADRFLWVIAISFRWFIAISFKRLARFEEWQNQTPLWQWYLLFDWFLAFFKYLLGNKFIRYKQMFLTYRWDSQHLVKIVFCIQRIVAMLIR